MQVNSLTSTDEGPVRSGLQNEERGLFFTLHTQYILFNLSHHANGQNMVIPNQNKQAAMFM